MIQFDMLGSQLLEGTDIQADGVGVAATGRKVERRHLNSEHAV